MRLLDVEEQGPRDRVGAISNGCDARRDAVDGRDLQLVGVCLIKAEAEHADRLLVAGQAGECLAVVAVDVHRHSVLANFCASLVNVFLRPGGRCLFPNVARARLLATGPQDLLLEHFARAMLFARHKKCDRPIRERTVHVLEALKPVVYDRAILWNLRPNSEKNVLRRQREDRALGVAREHNAVVAELHFDDIGHAVLRAIGDFFRLHFARGVGNVDCLLADARAELFDTSASSAALDDRGFELALLAEGFSDDVRIRQYRRRAGDLDLVACERWNGDEGACECGRHGGGGEIEFHAGLPLARCRSSSLEQWNYDSLTC